MPLWSEDIKVLFEKPSFLYSTDSSHVDNMNSLARSILIMAICMAAIGKIWLSIIILLLLPITLIGPSDKLSIGMEDQTSMMMKYCQIPSVDNPMANPNPSDWGNGLKLPACPDNAPEVGNRVKDELGSQEITGRVVESVGDIDSMRIGERTFYSVPSSTVPANRESFMHALYGNTIDRTLNRY